MSLARKINNLRGTLGLLQMGIGAVDGLVSYTDITQQNRFINENRPINADIVHSVDTYVGIAGLLQFAEGIALITEFDRRKGVAGLLDLMGGGALVAIALLQETVGTNVVFWGLTLVGNCFVTFAADYSKAAQHDASDRNPNYLPRKAISNFLSLISFSLMSIPNLNKYAEFFASCTFFLSGTFAYVTRDEGPLKNDEKNDARSTNKI